MNMQRYSPEFKDEAVRQIIGRGYSVLEVSQRLGVSSHSLYKWFTNNSDARCIQRCWNSQLAHPCKPG